MNHRRLQATNVSAIITDETDDYTAEFRVTGTIYPYTPTRIGRDPDDSCPAEGGEIEITEFELQGLDVYENDEILEPLSEEEVKTLEAEFGARIETDKKLRDHIHERLAEAAAEQDDGPDPDRYRD